MQETVYKCDHCNKPIGNVKHLSLSFGRFSGVAVPYTIEGEQRTWHIDPSLAGKFIHLHTTCMVKYFTAMIKAKNNAPFSTL